MSLSACKATSEKQVDRIGDDEQKPITKSEAIQIVDDDTENDSLSAVLQPSEWDILCKDCQMLPQDFTFVVNLNDGSNVTVCGQKVSMQNQVIVPSADTVTVDTLRSEVLFPLQETFDLIGIAWDIQNDVLSMACQYHIEADYGKDLPHLCSVNMQTLQVYDRDGVSYMTLPQKAQEQDGVLYIPLSWLEQFLHFMYRIPTDSRYGTISCVAADQKRRRNTEKVGLFEPRRNPGAVCKDPDRGLEWDVGRSVVGRQLGTARI